MPSYNFRNKITGEEWSDFMSISEKEEYLEKNPDITQQLTQINIGDAVRMGFEKPPSDFSKYVLGRVKEKNPLGNVERKFGNIPREW
jgi:formylmethanofuran dehydrogenase subunit A